MKKIKAIAAFFSLIVVVLLTGCSRQSADTVKIGITIANLGETFQTYVADAMRDYAEIHGENIELIFADGRNDATVQLSQVENFITQQLDAIIVLPVSTEATGPMMTSAKNADIPLMFVNRRPENMPDGAWYVGSKEFVAGQIQGRFIAEQLQGAGQVGILMGKLDTEATSLRTEGAESILDEYENIQIVRKQTALWTRDQGMTVMENWLAGSEHLNAVIANNDDMALGAISAIEAAGLKDEILVIGVDATPDALAYLEEGRLSGTVFQDAAGQGKGAIEAAMRLIDREDQEKDLWIPFQLVTHENMHDFSS